VTDPLAPQPTGDRLPQTLADRVDDTAPAPSADTTLVWSSMDLPGMDDRDERE
jgi:hypothetical protein